VLPLSFLNATARILKTTTATQWNDIYLPPITDRLNALLNGNLNFTTTDVSIFPYLCGFESQITGTLSPWCSIFTNTELRQYEYAQDLRYYYGIGDGVDLPSKMMLPFLNSLVGLLSDGPGQTGKAANGSGFAVPDLITAFLNDGQITELVAATGVMSDQSPLSGSRIPSAWKYIASRFVSMRGTVAFERLECQVPNEGLRNVDVKNETYIRILLNDAVYPLPSCKDGPGESCALSEYQGITSKKLAAAGNLRTWCNVTSAVLSANGNGTSGKGASFFTDLGGDWLASVSP
jgi:acid phosphatase